MLFQASNLFFSSSTLGCIDCRETNWDGKLVTLPRFFFATESLAFVCKKSADAWMVELLAINDSTFGFPLIGGSRVWSFLHSCGSLVAVWLCGVTELGKAVSRSASWVNAASDGSLLASWKERVGVSRPGLPCSSGELWTNTLLLVLAALADKSKVFDVFSSSV